MYEPWDLSPPVVPLRSTLYSLEPLGIGTPFVESLTGYIARLAAAHTVSVADLVSLTPVRDIVKGPTVLPQGGTLQRASRHGFQPMGYTLNCLTDMTRKWIEVLEAATLRRDLSVLTFPPFASVATRSFLLRQVRAWCPRCYGERREANSGVYDSLLWALRVVTVCPQHQQPLVTTCPHCSRTQHPLAAYSYPGSCSRCRRWLGLQQSANGADRAPCHGEAEYQLWVANAVGEFLVAVPHLPSRLLKDSVRDHLRSYVNHLTGGNQTAFAELVQISGHQILVWLTGRLCPRLDSLLRVCYRVGISLVTLVTDGAWDPAVGERLKELGCLPPYRSRMWPLNPDEIRRVLESALHEEPAPSVTAIARRLGCGRTSLYQVDRDLCRQITANHRRAALSPRRKRSGAGRICDEATIKQVLEQSLAPAHPAALHHLAQRLGYANADLLRRKFPDLCRAIIAKRTAFKKARLNAVKLALRAALKEDPPPSANEMSRRLGPPWYSWILQKHFPALCATLQSRRTQYRDSRMAELRKAFLALLSEDPPPSVAEACQRVGVSQRTFSRKFSDLRRAIATRYARHRVVIQKNRNESLRKGIYDRVFELHRQGIVPSWSRVIPMLSKDSLKNWDLRARCYKEARQKLEQRSNH